MLRLALATRQRLGWESQLATSGNPTDSWVPANRVMAN